MKLIYEHLDTMITWKKFEVPIIVIENIEYKNKFIHDLFMQSNSNLDSPFFICENDNKLNFETIINPFDLSVNQTSIINIVRKNYENLIQEDNIELSKLTAAISDYLNNIASSLPVNIEWAEQLNIKRLVQLFDLTIIEDSNSLLESILNYLQVNIQLGLNSLFIFVNLKQFLSKNEFINFYKSLIYEEIQVILIENKVMEVIGKEKYFIIDGDLCLIY